MRPVLVMSNNKINNSEKVVVVCVTDAKGKSKRKMFADSGFMVFVIF